MDQAIDYTAHVAADTARIVAVAADADLSLAVPSCPEWTLADLVWHLTEVQSFWAHVVEDLLDDPAQPDGVRGPESELVAGLEAAGTRLVDALRTADPAAACWTWSADQSVGFVMRRQAHEALIHRVDAELAAGLVPTGDAILAADGVDEILTVMMGGVPDWADFRPAGTTARVDAEDAGWSWAMDIGKMVGTSPTTGTAYDLDAIDIRAHAAAPTVEIVGPAFSLDRWLWGRAPLDELTVTGDAGVAATLRAIAVESTQ